MQKQSKKKNESKHYTEEELKNLGIYLKNNDDSKKIKKKQKTD